MRTTVSIAFLAAVVPVAASAQETWNAADGLTDEQIDRIAMQETIRRMASDMDPQRLAFLSALMADPEVVAALDATGEYLNPVPLQISLPQRDRDDPQFKHRAFDNADSSTIHSGSVRSVVARIICPQFRAHNPHKGSGVGTGGVPVVKAKSDAKCNVVPTGGGVPPAAELVNWELNMTLWKNTRIDIGPVDFWTDIPVGYASHERNGTWRPRRKQDPADGYEGTQVLHALGLCVNGTYRNFSTRWIDVPWPFYSSTFGFLGLRIKEASVDNC